MPRVRPHVTAERQLDAAFLKFDLPRLLAQIRTEDAWRRESHSAMTLIKSHGLRVVLVAMHAGVSLPPHRADGPITVQAIEGALSVSSETRKVSLRPGQLLMLHAGVYHVVEAIRDSAFLLTLSVDLLQPLEPVEAGL